MPSPRTPQQEDTSLRVMRILQANPDITQSELAQQRGISVGGLNYCLKALVEKGWVKMKNFAHSYKKFGIGAQVITMQSLKSFYGGLS